MQTTAHAHNAVEERQYSWKPQPGPQTAFMHCGVEEILFGGARGGGKTDAAIGKLLTMALIHGENYKAIFFRRELTQLAGVIERTKEIYPKHGAVYKEAAKVWVFPNGARVYFRHLEKDSDAEKYQGWSVQTLVFEEAGNFPSFSPIQRLKGILRSVHGINCQIIFTANPGGPGHNWVKKRFIDPAPLGYKILTEKDAAGRESHRVYIPSRVSDNKMLMENDPGYQARLSQTGSPELVRAWLEGDWNVIDGAYFPDFSVEKHVIRQTELPSWWMRYRSFDWGYASPFACYWWAVASEDWRTPCGKIIPKGAIVAYREWYGIFIKPDGEFEPNKGLRLFAEDIGRGIVEREKFERQHEIKIAFGVADPSTFSEDGGPSLAERMSRGAREIKHTLFWRPGDNKRVQGRGAIGGWDAMRSRLAGFEYSADVTAPMIFFMDSCTHAIRTIPMMQHDETHAEDMDTDGEDHACDAIRYACMARPWARPSPGNPAEMKGLHNATFNELMSNLDNQITHNTSQRIH